MEIDLSIISQALGLQWLDSEDPAPLNYAVISPAELVVACLQEGNESAWVEFVRRFQPLIARVALRVARQWGEPSPQVIDDLIQETYLKLCAERLRVLRNFKSAHEDAIYGYIKVFTAKSGPRPLQTFSFSETRRTNWHYFN